MHRIWLACLGFGGCLAMPQIVAAEGTSENIYEGERLFNHEWQPNDSLSPGGDGLGPVFNARSCVACHREGGRGGSGGLEHNARMVSLESAQVERIELRGPFVTRGLSELRGVYRVFGERASANFTLHHESTRPSYTIWKRQIESEGDGTVVGRTGIAPGGGNALLIRFTERNTPALFGAGRIDEIRADSLQQVAVQQARATRGRITGRVAQNVGRFGWRAQITSLREFVAGACANELGLQTSENNQPPLPTDADYGHEGVDMTDDQVDALTAYIASLPPPDADPPRDYAEFTQRKRGEKLFARLECSVCHTPDMQHVTAIYSDLLLHDMGRELSDPVTVTGRSLPTQYYGGSPVPSSGGQFAQEWRTPPLWGVRDSAPYLHDGRAGTIREAIEMHGGEAHVARRKFLALRPRAKDDLVAFVHGLGTP